MATKKTAGLSANAVVSSVLTDDMFTAGEVVEHEITLGDGSKRTMYFKQLSAIEWKQHMEAENSKDAKVRKESTARLIAKCVVEPDGRRALIPQQAARLKPSVSGAFFLAILEINGLFTRGVVKAEDADSDDDIIADDDAEAGEIAESEEDDAGN